ncbi:MAG: multiheme c-type cytochrome [Myxococcota bacterium]|nr:multiheme c-type cytochrome [Myxococcota bacterium]
MILLVFLLGARWEAPRVPAGAPPPAGLSGMRAADCGACHQTIYAEWQATTHAHAWTDRQFQQELSKAPEVAWVCINCHTPAGDQQVQETVATGEIRSPQRSDNPHFDQSWQAEGVTCMSCHYGQGAQGQTLILGPYGDQEAAPHPVRQEPHLQDSGLCMGCHQAVARVEDTLVCTFNTGAEWEASGAQQSCQECHMPAIERPLIPQGEPRQARRHLWIGSKIPKEPLQPEWEPYYDLFEPGVDVALELPEQAEEGSLVVGSIQLHNARAGHSLPSGDPERYLWVEATVVDAQGQVVQRTTHRVGQRWVWWPRAERLDDNRLQAGEQREIPLRFVLPPGGAEITLSVDHYRISPENAAYHGLEDYPTHHRVAHLTHTLSAGD